LAAVIVPLASALSICAVVRAFRAAWKPLFSAATVMPRFDATVFAGLVLYAKSRFPRPASRDPQRHLR